MPIFLMLIVKCLYTFNILLLYLCCIYNKLLTLEILIHPQVLGLCALLVIYEYYCTLLKYNGFGNNYSHYKVELFCNLLLSPRSEVPMEGLLCNLLKFKLSQII